MFSQLTNQSALGDPRRTWATLASFAVQAMAVSFLLAMPLLRPGMLPGLSLMSPQVLLAPPAPAPAPQGVKPDRKNTTSEMAGTTLVSPGYVPDKALLIDDHGQMPQPIGADELGVIGSTGSDRASSTLQALLGRPSANPPAHVTAQKPIARSVMMEGNLIHRVQPDYPPLARSAGIQGVVVLQAVISRQGAIENLRVISGHPMLVRAAVEAVMQWRYRPYSLNGKPIEVETQITVNFTLSRG
jgi:protein TonB